VLAQAQAWTSDDPKAEGFLKFSGKRAAREYKALVFSTFPPYTLRYHLLHAIRNPPRIGLVAGDVPDK